MTTQLEMHSIDAFVKSQAATGKWREETVSPELTGLTRPIRIYRARRKNDLVTHKWHGTKTPSAHRCGTTWA
jgi:hypothetical protein